MLEATSTLSGLGFSPLNYVEMWAAASQAKSSQAFAPASSGAATTTASAATGSSSAGTGSAAASLFASTEEIDLQVELSIARLKAAAQQALRNRAAQLAAGGSYVRGGSYAYTIGADGQLYATGVTVSYDTAPVADDPQATIQKMRQVRTAALASSSPTASDYAAAATAMQVEMQARLELVQEMAAQYLGTDSNSSATLPGSLFSVTA